MTVEHRVLPIALEKAHKLGFFEDHDGHDFQPDAEFEWSVETTEWWRAWTGDSAVESAPLRVFGVDGSGGKAAFWTRLPDAAIETQPIVFLGSEGETRVIARDLGDYLWLLANGVGPLESVDGIHRTAEPLPALVALAQQYTGIATRSLEAVMAAAGSELAALTALIESTTR
ncbi:SMI1/KNR4 family protein [Dactylosporangium sp. CA-052675]|uniref:SMI1/KNR4 family protein n=1 Tax=Dactylosporangium sp. CA-052675 TaxID=3239927 RepID=UPI003D91DCAC